MSDKNAKDLPSFPACGNYEDLRAELCKLPATWYGDLIASMAEAAYEKDVFVPGGASHLMRNLEKRLGQTKARGEPMLADEAQAAKEARMPPEVFEVFNDMILDNLRGNRSSFKKDDVLKRVAERLHVSEGWVLSENMLDVEPMFRRAGWKVFYDKPGFNETYPATFTFSRENKP